VRVEATWESTPTHQAPDAIGCYSASVALPLLDEQQATKLAVGHGLCTRENANKPDLSKNGER
jgi:hypothetical protein